METISFFFSSRRRHTRCSRDWSSDVCSSDLVVIVVETLGAACVIVGLFTRPWALCMMFEMAVAMIIQLHGGHNIELEGLLFAGALTLVALGDGPLSIAIRFKRPPA